MPSDTLNRRASERCECGPLVTTDIHSVYNAGALQYLGRKLRCHVVLARNGGETVVAHDIEQEELGHAWPANYSQFPTLAHRAHRLVVSHHCAGRSAGSGSTVGGLGDRGKTMGRCFSTLTPLHAAGWERGDILRCWFWWHFAADISMFRCLLFAMDCHTLYTREHSRFRAIAFCGTWHQAQRTLLRIVLLCHRNMWVILCANLHWLLLVYSVRPSRLTYTVFETFKKIGGLVHILQCTRRCPLPMTTRQM